jgi:hypothetical protein
MENRCTACILPGHKYYTLRATSVALSVTEFTARPTSQMWLGRPSRKRAALKARKERHGRCPETAARASYPFSLCRSRFTERAS